MRVYVLELRDINCQNLWDKKSQLSFSCILLRKQASTENKPLTQLCKYAKIVVILKYDRPQLCNIYLHCEISYVRSCWLLVFIKFSLREKFRQSKFSVHRFPLHKYLINPLEVNLSLYDFISLGTLQSGVSWHKNDMPSLINTPGLDLTKMNAIYICKYAQLTDLANKLHWLMLQKKKKKGDLY